MLTKEVQKKVDAAWTILKHSEMSFTDFWQVVRLLELQGPHFDELLKRWQLHKAIEEA